LVILEEAQKKRSICLGNFSLLCNFLQFLGMLVFLLHDASQKLSETTGKAKLVKGKSYFFGISSLNSYVLRQFFAL